MTVGLDFDQAKAAEVQEKTMRRNQEEAAKAKEEEMEGTQHSILMARKILSGQGLPDPPPAEPTADLEVPNAARQKRGRESSPEAPKRGPTKKRNMAGRRREGRGGGS